MEDYQLRVVSEYAQLADRMTKLEAFLGSDKVKTVSTRQEELMRKQLEGMQAYLSALKERIEDFKGSE